MGYLYRDVCYPKQADARQVACSKFDAKVMVSTNLYTAECTSTVYTGANMSICKRTNGGACTTVSPPWPTMPTCAHDGGVSLSYDYFLAAITVLAAVWGGKKLIQLFDVHHEKD